MTFFANSGAAFPRFELETRDAGSDSLDAASKLWKIFASLERGDASVNRADADACARDLRHAAQTYRKLAKELKTSTVAPLSPAEQSLAGLSNTRRYDDGLIGALLHNHVSLGDLYLELYNHADVLASSIKSLHPSEEVQDLAPQVFQMMWHWSEMAAIARAVAVVNRRSLSN